MDLHEELEHLRESLQRAERIQTELDRRVFHLKTLYDVGNDIFGIVEAESILRNFLLMTMGNFGVARGFILVQDVWSKKIKNFTSVGFPESEVSSLQEGGKKLLRDSGI